MTTLPQAIQFARNYVADPEGWNAPSPDKVSLILAQLEAQREALKAALPWLIKADNDGAFVGCALPLGGRKTIERIERTIAATTPTSEPAPPAGETEPERTPATQAQIARARSEYGNDELEIDDNALASRNDESGGTWVAAWVWLADEEEV